VIRVVVFDSDGGIRSGGEELVFAPLAEGAAIWIDLEGPDKRFEGWFRDWGFHPLAIEDTFTLAHQPKVEEYGETMFIIVRGLDFNFERQDGGDIRTLKLAAFLSKSRLVTTHRGPMRSLETVRERLKASQRSFPGGPVQVLWSVYDEMMDHYFPVVDELAKIRAAGEAIRQAGMRFNAGHALNYFNVQPVAALPGVRELHIGHAIVSRSVFVGMREAVRQMKALLREAAA